MKKIAVLHGNPGHVDDFKALTAKIELPAGYEWSLLSLPDSARSEEAIFQVLDRAMPAGDKLWAMGFSFGSYLLLQWAKARGREFEKLLLLNPTVAVEHPIPFLKQAIVSMPLLGAKILAKSAPKLAQEFVDKTFAPQKAPTDEARRMLSYLNRGETWGTAMARKVIGQNKPLEGSFASTAKRVVVVRGGNDEAIPWVAQELTLKAAGFPSLETHVMAGVGHSLPWTFGPELVSIIQKEFGGKALAAHPEGATTATFENKRIGYQPGEVPTNNVICYMESHRKNIPNRTALRRCV